MGEIVDLRKHLTERDDIICVLRRDLGTFQDKSMNLCKTVDQLSSGKKNFQSQLIYKTSGSKSPHNPN